MPEVYIAGWRKGCNTVAAIKEIRERAALPLDQAHNLVNRVLNNEQVVVPVSSPEVARELADSLSKLGLITRE